METLMEGGTKSVYLENFMHIGVQTTVITKQEFVTQQLLRVLLTPGVTVL